MGRMRLSVSRNRWLIIAVIGFLIGLIIRFYYGLTTDFWNDEAISYFNSTDLSWRELFFRMGIFPILGIHLYIIFI
jgi:nitrate reductase gamma subunit